MYNLNDHKKIDLASNKLNNLISRFNTKKETTYSGQERPKSGVNWNQNVIPFLRPYTATR
jgi:predicted PolB exonuclease-like 3'-5' exonuclease